jgi:predicted nucleotidyltransferase
MYRAVNHLSGTLEKLGLSNKELNFILENWHFSVRTLKELQKKVLDSFNGKKSNNDVCLAVVGSYGRLEASISSDLDYLLIYNGEEKDISNFRSFDDQISQILDEMDIKKPSGVGKTFESPACITQLTKNIGGNKDKTQHLTWRVLLLTESKCLYNPELYEQILSQIYTHYTKTSSEKRGYPRALINELIRYYRTVAVDYLYKVEEINKPWALRNFKLRHSRKFWFFTSMALILHKIKEFSNHESDRYYPSLFDEIRLPPIEKLATILLESDKKDLITPFRLYNDFLGIINNPKTREELSEIDYDSRYDNSSFLELRQKSENFHEALLSLFHEFEKWDDLVYDLFIL